MLKSMDWLGKIPAWVWWAVATVVISTIATAAYLSKSGYTGFIILIPLGFAGVWMGTNMVMRIFVKKEAWKQSKQAAKETDLDEELKRLIEGKPLD